MTSGGGLHLALAFSAFAFLTGFCLPGTWRWVVNSNLCGASGKLSEISENTETSENIKTSDM